MLSLLIFVSLKHVAYEYARRGACLVLVARREDCLQKVADKARELRSPEVIVVRADVSKVEECKRFVEEALNHFGRCKCMCDKFSVFYGFLVCGNILGY
jgi:NAD(P)-dependent dehydrogenase (short-subunit alcohol dehydrogenase family)